MAGPWDDYAPTAPVPAAAPPAAAGPWSDYAPPTPQNPPAPQPDAPKVPFLDPGEGGWNPEALDHSAFTERLQKGTVVSKLYDELSKIAKEGAMVDTPLGIEPGGEADQWLSSHGSLLRATSDTLVKPAAKLFDLVSRVFNTGTYAAGELAGKLDEMAGASQGDQQEASRDVKGILDMAMLVSGSEGPTPFSRVSKTADGRIIDEPVGAPATPEDVSAAAKIVHNTAGTEPLPTTDAKVRALHNEYGIHPSEVAADAQRDPELAKDLASGSSMLPSRYTGFDPLQAAREQITSGGAPKPTQPSDLDLALQQRLSWPDNSSAEPASSTANTPRVTFGSRVASVIDRMGFGNAARDVQMKLTPMAANDAGVAQRASAKDFANTLRTAAWDHQFLDTQITKNFDEAAQKRMWDAADADTVSVLKGEKPEAVAQLAPEERRVVEQLRQHASDAWLDAEDAGTFDRFENGRQGLPLYAAPRMMAAVAKEGDFAGSTPNLPWRIGQNLRTAAASLRRREYLTADETEAAGKAALGDDAQLVRNIRTLPLGVRRLREATAGRRLINQIRAMSELQDEGTPATVHEGGVPAGDSGKYFTIDHPAFKTYRPRLDRGDDGKLHAVLDNNGDPVMDHVPLFVRKDFEGPLRAVLNQENGAAYKGFLTLKAKSMSVIMYSPAMHNMVVAGRALPAVKGNPFALARLYFAGNKMKSDPVLMRQAVQDGLVPFMRQHGQVQDVTGIIAAPELDAGRSITAKLASAVPDLFSKSAGNAVRASIDKMGDFVHNKLLWDRVGDLQAGLYSRFRAEFANDGFSDSTASRAAAHMANRYTGAIPQEAMSAMARKVSNVLMFSRSYTLGQIGLLKDMAKGLPADVLAQIERDGGIEEMNRIQDVTQRKAIATVAVDVALFYGGNALMQSAFSVKNNNVPGNEEIERYAERFQNWYHNPSANPFSAFGFFKDVPPQADNEPRGQDKVLTGYTKDGTAIYMRNPVGKTGEELSGWLTRPVDMMRRKVAPIVKPFSEVYANQDFAGRKIYDPYADTPGSVLRNITNVVGHFVSAQVPSDVLGALRNLVESKDTDSEKKVDTLRVLGPLFGFTFSKGFPGGPALGENFKHQQEQSFDEQAAIPDAMELARHGDSEGARAALAKVGMDPRKARFLVQNAADPSARTLRKSFRIFHESLNGEDRARLDRMMSDDKRANGDDDQSPP